jgi:hypothetical protein
MRAFISCSILAWAAGLACAAAAADRQAQPADFAVFRMHRFGECVVDRGPREAEALLALDYRTEAYGRAMRRLSRDRSRCLFNGRLRFSSLLFAGTLAEQLVEKGRTKDKLVDLLTYDPSKPTLRARDETEVMALCTVRKAPQSVVGLLATAPASDAEEAAIKSLAPTVASCVAQGKNMRVNRPGLRALLALAAYRAVRGS